MPELLRAPTREYRAVEMDSHRWDSFKPRSGDIVVATYPKCGTTWTQRIVDMLIHQSTAARPIMETYPWLDATIFNALEVDIATLESQSHRRSVKSHLPFDSLPIYDTVKYIHVARDGRDACFSFHNHLRGFTDEAKMRFGQAAAEAFGPDAGPPPDVPDDPVEFYRYWIAGAEEPAPPDGPTEVSFFDYEMTYWRERRRSNLLLVHYNDLKADLAGEIARISAFLDIETPPRMVQEMAAAAQFDRMKSQGAELLPTVQIMFDRGHERFLNKGTNGRWKDSLSKDDLEVFDRVSAAKFTPSARAWIEGGRLTAGDPVDLPD